ncbi:MAG: glutathione S-transferase family protein [Pseudomonadales bacterium]|nr:glutathione S-transferase family protein [Pseudomonadales bacterium]
MPAYTVFGNELSYFSRKLEAAMRLYELDFSLQPKSPERTQEIETRAGTHQVPVLLTPENWMIADTTPLLQLLDARVPRRTMFPSGASGLLIHLVEEYFDEWVARTMVHYRWHYEESAVFASLRIAAGNADAAARVRAWGPRACRATGTDSTHQQRMAEDEYQRLLDAMERQLRTTRYLMGDRPTAVDCVVLGGLRAHTWMDPTPKRVVAAYPAVVDWVEHRADAWDGLGDLPAFPETTDFGHLVLADMREHYLPFALANRDALNVGAKACQVETYSEIVSYLTRPYPERSRQMLVNRLQGLPDDEQARGQDWLKTVGLLPLLT